MEAETETISFGISSKGHHTVMNRNFEYIKVRDNKNGETYWRCRMFRTLKCKAHLKTIGDRIVGHRNLEHTHQCNISKALARQAIAEMKSKMIETSATPNAIIGTVSSMLDNRILMALPKKSTLGRALQRHRKAVLGNFNKGVSLPKPNANFEVPGRFDHMIMCDSGRKGIFDHRRPPKQYQEVSEYRSIEGDMEMSNPYCLPFIKSEQTLDEIDSNFPHSFAEVDDMDFNSPITTSSIKTEGARIVPPPKKPIVPVSAWQAVLDDSSQCYYYYNTETEESVWEMPPEYTKFLVQHKKYEQERSEYTKELKNWQKLNRQVERISSKVSIKKERFSPPVSNDCSNEINKSEDDILMNGRTVSRVLVDEASEGKRVSDDDDNVSVQNKARLNNISISMERSFRSDDDPVIPKRCSKKSKFDESCLPTFVINNNAVQQRISQLEEISRLTTQIGAILKCYGDFQGTNHESPQFIYAAIQTRIEDWEAGHLSTSYVVSKLKNCLETVNVWKQQVNFELPQEIENEISTDMTCLRRAETPTDLPSHYGNEALPTIEVDQQPPLPPDNTKLFLTTPPKLPPVKDDPRLTPVSRSLISPNYDEYGDKEEENEAEPPSPSCFHRKTSNQDKSNHIESSSSTIKKSYNTALPDNKSPFLIASRTKRTGVVMGGSNNLDDFDSF